MLPLDQNQILAELKIQNLHKKVDDFFLSADFSIGVGERVALCGKSGSGKTTLLRVLAGLESLNGTDESGRIFLGKKELTSLSPQKREIGFVFQDAALFPHLNVLDNVTFGLRMRGMPRAQRDELAHSWLDRVGLHAQALSSVHRLSGGEKQRVAFIRALIWKPQLILLDEPFSALDLELRDVLRKELVHLHHLWPAPLLLVTHDEADIQAVATAQLQLNWESQSSLRTVKRSSERK